MGCFFMTIPKINAQSVLDLAITTTTDLTQNRLFYEDQTGNLTFEEIQKETFASKFESSTKEPLNYGFTGSAIWLKIKIKNTNLQKNDYLALMDFAVLDEVDFYFVSPQETVVYKTGDITPFTERMVDYRKYIFPLSFQDTSLHTLYIRAANKATLQLPFKIITTSEFQKKITAEELGFGIFYGILLIMIAYNFFIFVSLKDFNYVYYIISISGSLLLFFSLAGHQSQYLLPNSPLFANQLVPCGSAFIMMGISLFTAYFNEVRKHHLILYYLLWFAFFVGIATLLASLLLPNLYGRVIFFTNLFGLFLSIIVLTSSIYCFKKGHKASRFFIVAFSFYIVGIVVLILKNLGVIPSNFLTSNAGEIGASLEVLFLSFALSDRYNIYKTQKEATQKTFLEMEKNAKETLEKKVTERTKELQQANNELATLNQEIHQKSEEIKAQRDALSNTTTDLEKTVKELDKQKTDILSSINYAKTIQRAMLPFQERISHALDAFFVFYKPRDIVSGDFYFFEEKKTHIIFGAFDCTGHGVPGAFMSMIAHQILSDIVNVKKIYSPDLILEELHNKVYSSLQQEQTQNRDGMDGAIVSIKKNKTEKGKAKFETLEYAGAMNPFYYVQTPLDASVTTELVCTSIKATKNTIGGKTKQNEIRKFEKHTIQLEGYKTNFWLCTDGFQDQFGGEKNKKFMVKNFRELLFSMHDKDVKEQYKIIRNTFINWKGFNKQVDDVLVIGAEI